MDSHVIYAVCAVSATLIFSIIAFFLVKALKAVLESVQHVNSSLFRIENKIEPLVQETLRLLENSNKIAIATQDKLSDLNPILDSINHVSAAVNKVTQSFNENEDENPCNFYHVEKKNDWNEIVGDLIKLSTIGVKTWQKIKKGR
jgi:uncharacterized protein YoxC